MADINLALTESKTLRNSKLSEYSNNKAFEAMSKAKALVMAFWKGENIATTEQLAEYYEVSEDVIRDNIRRHKDEFELDGLKVLRGKELSHARETISLASKTSQAVLWTPRAALRLGMLLRDSEVAKAVRTSLLDTVEKIIPAQV